jgi:hypothetical protein
MNKFFDKKGREIKEYDVLKVFHYVAALRRKKVYMYKWVRIDNEGYFTGNSLSHCGHTYRLRACANSEGILEDSEIVQRGGKFDPEEDL